MPSLTPTVLCLHGLGATAGVWTEVIEALRRHRSFEAARILAPDLPGHGSSPWTGAYDLSSLATAVETELEDTEPALAIGHSLGGGVALELASGRYRPNVVGVVGIGIKTTWTEDDVAQMAGVAAKGIRWFDSRDDAEVRFLRQAGLHGVVEADHPAVAGGVVAEDGRWRVAQDPATFAQRPLDMAGLVERAQCPVVLAAGEHDPMATAAELSRYTESPRIASGRGHNAQVEDPAWVADLAAGVLADAH